MNEKKIIEDFINWLRTRDVHITRFDLPEDAEELLAEYLAELARQGP